MVLDLDENCIELSPLASIVDTLRCRTLSDSEPTCPLLMHFRPRNYLATRRQEVRRVSSNIASQRGITDLASAGKERNE
jgi:hypothetical protein